MPCNQPAHQHVGGKSWNTLQKQGETKSELTLNFIPPLPNTAKHIHPILLPCTLQMCPQSLPQQCAAPNHQQIQVRKDNVSSCLDKFNVLINAVLCSTLWIQSQTFFLKCNQGPDSVNSSVSLDRSRYWTKGTPAFGSHQHRGSACPGGPKNLPPVAFY